MGNIDFEKINELDFLQHFGIRLDKRKTRLYLERDNYCVIDRKSYTKVPAHNELFKNWDKCKEQKKILKYEGLMAIIPSPRIKI